MTINPDGRQSEGVTPAGPGLRPFGAEPQDASQAKPLVPNALNITQGLYLESDGSVWPVTNWFDEDGDECPRAAAVTCVAGHGGCWFSLVIADFVSAGDSQ